MEQEKIFTVLDVTYLIVMVEFDRSKQCFSVLKAGGKQLTEPALG